MWYIYIYIQGNQQRKKTEVNVNKNTDESEIYKIERESRQKYKDTGQQAYSH